MDPYTLLKAIGFLLLVIIGIPGNVFIMMQFTYLKITEKKLLPTNFILMVLALVNLLVILSRIIPQSINALGVEELLDDTECKFVIFTYRVNRAMSICVTSFLSCYQCILIAPNTKIWMYLKHKVTQNVVAIILFFWIINIAIYPYVFFSSHARRNQTTSPYTLHLVYCDSDFLNYMAYIVNGSIYSLRDFIFVGPMALASSYIVFILLSHEKSVKGIRSSDRTQRRSVEYRASKAVILLVALYVLLYGLDNCMWIYTLTLSNVTTNMGEIRIFLASSYASLSPIVIIITNPKLQQNLLTCSKKRHCQGDFKTGGYVYAISK
ncbi:olfactory receptor class A-like protein 1 [Xenopus laevis]|uniref:Vomeronasal type-1 receptor n=2 Tax=Xenopus laevis TaxID=8355 RepID=A0A1L8H6C4_XENLA|nr:olfactory receptor class A-like protein 1 [Xenopus laevis]OCT91596.1 hypothetical protein XELAEV_18014655mg [Xenopus laevis]